MSPPERAGTYDYAAYSELSGPFVDAPEDYRVTYTSVNRSMSRRLAGIVLAWTALAFEALFMGWLLWPSHHPADTGDAAYHAALVLIGFVAVIESLRLVNVTTLCLSTLRAKDPRPVRPEPGLRVAFLTTIVPGKEPVETARATLAAALRMRHDGVLDVWLLDEGDDPGIRAMCAGMGVRHFSRRGVERWNQPSGAHKAKTKHGNYNAWLDAHGDAYDLWVSVDTDHVPLENFAERLLGYFRDPDVAFVVAPQVYGNCDNFVTRAAESQQYLFHSVIQRAANSLDAAMFVGTNNAVRISALRAVGGLQDSVTEDMATGMAVHAARNPATGARWKSVYTPDVLAVGEGPTSWTDYFSQQYRWSAGTNSIVLGGFLRFARGLGPRRLLYYALLTSYYPSAAISWVLGTVNLMAYFLTGLGSVQVAASIWLMLYVNAAALQIGIYTWNRRHNVSPHEEYGSSGARGMLISVLSAPVYVSSLLNVALRRDKGFVVTAKGADRSRDGVRTFRQHGGWALLLLGSVAASLPLQHGHPAMRAWALSGVLVSLLPLLIWAAGLLRAGSRPEPEAAPTDITLPDDPALPSRAVPRPAPAADDAPPTADVTIDVRDVVVGGENR